MCTRAGPVLGTGQASVRYRVGVLAGSAHKNVDADWASSVPGGVQARVRRAKKMYSSGAHSGHGTNLYYVRD